MALMYRISDDGVGDISGYDDADITNDEDEKVDGIGLALMII